MPAACLAIPDSYEDTQPQPRIPVPRPGRLRCIFSSGSRGSPLTRYVAAHVLDVHLVEADFSGGISHSDGTILVVYNLRCCFLPRRHMHLAWRAQGHGREITGDLSPSSRYNPQMSSPQRFSDPGTLMPPDISKSPTAPGGKLRLPGFLQLPRGFHKMQEAPSS